MVESLSCHDRNSGFNPHHARQSLWGGSSIGSSVSLKRRRLWDHAPPVPPRIINAEMVKLVVHIRLKI